MKRVLFFVPAVLYYALIFYLSSKSYEVEVNILFFDKGIHIVEFAILGFFLSLGCFQSIKLSFKGNVIFILATGILLGGLDEWHQSFVPLRSSDILDMVADAAGIFIGLFIYVNLTRLVKRKFLK
jgi:VanZ family protein